MDTTVEVKRKYFDKFVELMRRQWEHGGDKYKLNNEKEVTDWIVEIDDKWVMATIAKYVGRYINFRRERDLLKIATYCFIQWLKDDHHLKEEHDIDVSKEKIDI